MDEPTEPRSIATQFQTGNAGGPGNPMAKRAKRQGALFRRAITDQDVIDIARNLVMQAKMGNIKAAKLVLDKILPKEGKGDGDIKDKIAQIVLVMPDDGRAGGQLYDDIDDCDIIDAGETNPPATGTTVGGV